jgi:D-aminopeptidase
MTSEKRLRARELGISIGRLSPGRWNAITDVPGIRVGHATLIEGDGPLVVGQGPIRTGVTVIMPNDNIKAEPLFAGYHVLNGCGEMTGLVWVAESGLLVSPIALTNTYSVGVVHDALIELEVAWGLPVAAETYDGFLSDIKGMHVRAEHVRAAIDSASSGPVVEGCVGGGTGMICHGFKGGIGTSSRVLVADQGGWTIGVLVQANHGQRELLRVNGMPVGHIINSQEVPNPWDMNLPAQTATSSIIVAVATDAPLLPIQCRRLAQRAALGVGRAGGLGENGSGDIFIAFSTANQNLAQDCPPGEALSVRMLPHDALTPLFEAVADATEEAIVNALCAATTVVGIDGHTAQALPLDRLQEVMQNYGRETA